MAKCACMFFCCAHQLSCRERERQADEQTEKYDRRQQTERQTEKAKQANFTHRLTDSSQPSGRHASFYRLVPIYSGVCLFVVFEGRPDERPNVVERTNVVKRTSERTTNKTIKKAWDHCYAAWFICLQF